MLFSGRGEGAYTHTSFPLSTLPSSPSSLPSFFSFFLPFLLLLLLLIPAQARAIAEDIRQRHQRSAMACSVQGGKGGKGGSCSAAVPLRWSDMACLFRCAKMGAMGTLHSSLQQELQKLEVPFTVSTNRYDAL